MPGHYGPIFDGVWAMSSIVHVPIKSLYKYFEGLALLVKKDGFLYFSILHSENPHTRYFVIPGQEKGRFMTAINIQVLNNYIDLFNSTQSDTRLELISERLNEPIAPGVQWWSVIIQKK